MKIRALSSFFHPQEGARAEGRDTKRCWILMDSHRRATQTRLLRLAHAVKCRRQRSPCRRQQLRREALPPCALLHRVQALGSENLNRLNLVLVSAGWEKGPPKMESDRSGPNGKRFRLGTTWKPGKRLATCGEFSSIQNTPIQGFNTNLSRIGMF